MTLTRRSILTATCAGCQNLKAVVVDNKTVIGGRCTVLRTFTGPTAADDASAFIGTLPEHETGRYGLDVGDGEA